jgi:translocation and assembly module TamB
MTRSNREQPKRSLDEIKPWRFILTRTGLFFSFFSGSVLLCGVTGANWGRIYAQEKLTPQIAQLLSESIDRPVQLGAVQQVSPTGIRLGASTIPATETDRDQVEIEAIDVQFNVRDLLSQRKVKLTVTLVQPTIFLDQDDAGNWLNTEITLDGEDMVEVQQIRLRDATVELMPRSKPMRSLVNNPEAQGIPIAPNRVLFQQVNLALTLPDADSQVTFTLTGKAEAGGNFQVHGKANLEQEMAIVQVRSNHLAVTALNPILPRSVRLDAGQLTSNLQVQIQPNQAPSLQGTAKLANAAAQVRKEPNLFTQVNGRLRFEGQQITVAKANLAYGQIPFQQVTGTIHFQDGLDLHARVDEAGVAEVLHTFKLKVPFAVGGTLRTDDLRVTGPLKGAIFSGTVSDNNLIQSDRLQSNFLGRFTLNTDTDRLSFHELKFTPTVGGQVVATGDIILGEAAKGEPDNVDLSVEVRDLSGDKIAQLYDAPLPVAIGSFNGKAQIQVFDEIPSIQGNWHLKQGTFPAQGTVTFANETLQFQNTQIQVGSGILRANAELAQGRWQLAAAGQEISLSHPEAGKAEQFEGEIQLTGEIDRPIESAQGTIAASIQSEAGTVRAQGRLNQGQWQASLQSHDLNLARLSPEMPGALTGEVNLAGSLANLNPQSIRAEGQIQLSEGISSRMALLNQPLETAFLWKAGKLHIQQLSMAGLAADGWIAAHFQGRSPQITEVALDLHLQDYDLATLPNMPMPVQGTADFQGRVTGTPTTPSLDGTLRLQHLVLNEFALDPDLKGDVTMTADHRVALNLAGNRDRIALVLDEFQRLETLAVKLDQATAQVIPAPGTPPNEQHLWATLDNFPLEILNLQPIESLGTVSGLLSGQFALNLTEIANPKVLGEIAIEQPAIGAFNANSPSRLGNNRFEGTVQYGDRTFALTNGTLHLGSGQYHLTSTLQLSDHSTAAPQFIAQLSTTTGTLEDLHATLPDPAWETLLASLPQPASSAPLLPNPASQTPSPDRRSFLPQQGTFSTDIALHHSPQTGLSIAFNLQGEDWVWQDYRIRQVSIANGQFDGTRLALSPALLQGLVYQPPDRPAQSYDARLSFSGQIGNGQTGHLQAEAIPIALIAHHLNLPIPIGGSAEGTFTLAGDVHNPDVVGTIAVLGVHLNQREIKDLQIDFRYRNQQFQLEDWTVID